MKEEGSLYEQIERYVYMHDPCYQSDIVKCFSDEYSKQYITKTCYQLWEDGVIYREKSGSTYIVSMWIR